MKAKENTPMKHTLTLLAALLLAPQISFSEMRNLVVLDSPGEFAGWPANNGMWVWDSGREMLVGCTLGKFKEQPSHNIDMPYRSVILRSTDAGESWTLEDPTNFVGDVTNAVPCPGGINFANPDLAIRCVGSAYHGSDDTYGSFFVSTNRGHCWSGPFRFNGINDVPDQKGREQTPRTDYLPMGPRSCLFFLASRPAHASAIRDRAYVASTDDGGATFQFVNWIVPTADPFRAVMPSTVLVGKDDLVSALRRRTDKDERFWIDAYFSRDGGKHWALRSEIGSTGAANGNPPALAKLRDGTLCCVYGDRKSRRMIARFSSDKGQTWGAEIGLRSDFKPDKFGDADFGYPRLAQRPDVKHIALYYFATTQNPRQHIAATIFDAVQ